MILLYHHIYPDNTSSDQWSPGPIITLKEFRRQIFWMRKHHKIVSINEYLESGKPKRRLQQIALTFDDGLRETYETVAPFLEEEGIPALIFVSTSHIEQGKILWFNYLNALCFERQYRILEIDGHTYKLDNLFLAQKVWQQLLTIIRRSENPEIKFDELEAKYPLQSSITSKYEGMNGTQLQQAGMSQVIELGGHTHTHPFLDSLNRSRKIDEIFHNKNILEKVTNKSIRYFAYPSNAYDKETIDVVKDAGYMAAFSVKSRNLSDDSNYEINRTGIYSKSIVKLQLKLMGIDKIRKDVD